MLKNSLLKNKQLVVALITAVMSSTSYAQLSIDGVPQPRARIAWGGSDNLVRAQEIMSSNTPAYNTYNSPNQYGSSYGNPFGHLNITTGSSGVMVVDAETGNVMYEKNAHVARPIASISKLMTAMVVLDAGLDLHEEIIIKPFDFVAPKRASSNLKVGDRLNRTEMLLLMLMKSENPAAKALARNYPGGYTAFMAAMNRKAQELGMTSAYFGDPSGLDVRNVASPVDLVKMVKAASQYSIIHRFSTTANYNFNVVNFAVGNRPYNARNTSYLVRDGLYPLGISKTGFINEAGKCVVMETRFNNRSAIVVILGARDSRTRWGDAEKILDNLANRRYT